MAGPYRYPQAPAGRSPFDRQGLLSNPPPAHPQSYKTNVNRAKTKKWTQAPEYSYDGDDWGELDEYDEYGAYNEAPALPNQTGIPQNSQGQGTTPEATRSFTSPESSNLAMKNRSNSFDAGDERRTFSSGNPARPAPGQQTSNDEWAPTVAGRNPEMASSDSARMPRQSPVEPPSNSFHDHPVHQGVPAHQYHSPDTDAETFRETHAQFDGKYGVQHSRDGDRVDVVPDFAHSTVSHAVRRDFSQPSALPAPLQMRGSPARQMGADAPSSEQFPPRKSSLSQRAPFNSPGPALHQSGGFSQELEVCEAQPEEDNMEAPPPPKPLPFIRPADIYKRIEEEREKERRSSESSGPSVSESGVVERGSIDSLARAAQRKASLDPVDEVGSESEPQRSLGLAAESKSKPTFQGFAIPNPVLARAIGADVAQPATSATNEPHNLNNLQPSQAPTTHIPMKTSHVLPPVNRVSTFGSDFWPSAHTPVSNAGFKNEQFRSGEPLQSDQSNASDIEPSSGSVTLSTDLYHQPSTGLRSVVHQAFDRRDDSSFPPTPLSSRPSQNSKLGSDLGRSESDSTGGISPIMSGVPGSLFQSLSVPSAVNGNERRTHTITEEPVQGDAQHPRALSDGLTPAPDQFQRESLPIHSGNESEDSVSTSLQAGYRKGFRTPTPGQTSARSPTIETPKETRVPEAGEMGTISASESEDFAPATESSSPSKLRVDTSVRTGVTDSNSREAGMAKEVNLRPQKKSFEVGDSAREAQTNFLDSRLTEPFSPVYPTASPSPSPRAESPSKGRVRELASRFEDVSDSRRNSQHSVRSKISVSSWERSQEDLAISQQDPAGQDPERRGSADSSRSRPVTDTARRFRPRLPGEWISYATTAAPLTPSVSSQDLQRRITPSPTRTSVDNAVQQTPSKIQNDSNDEDIDVTPTTRKTQLEGKESDTFAGNAMASVAAAGQALAESLMRSMGVTNEAPHSDTSSEAGDPKPTQKGAERPLSSQDRVGAHTYLRPLAIDRPGSSAGSSAAPTPPPKDTPRIDGKYQYSGYFPSSHAQEQGERARPDYRTESPRQTRPLMVPQLSIDASPTDQESDRLRKDIVRSLSPYGTRERSRHEEVTALDHGQLREPKSMDKSRESTFMPSEYDSYWAEGKDDGHVTAESLPYSNRDLEPDKPRQEVQPSTEAQIPDMTGKDLERPRYPYGGDAATTVEMAGEERPSFLDKRFSWEAEQDETVQTSQTTAQPLEATHEHPLSEPYEPRDADQRVESIPSYQTRDEFHDLTPQRSEVMPQLGDQSPISDIDDAVDHNAQSTIPISREISPPAHILHPTQSLDTSPALSHDTSDDRQPREETEEALDLPEVPPKSPRTSIDRARQSLDNLPRDAARPVTPQQLLSGHAAIPTSPTSRTRIPPFREILAIKSSTERIATFNQTRHQFADMNTGLADWITATLAAHPEHNNITSIATAKPNATPSALPGTIRVGGHKVSPSISKIVKIPTTSATPANQPYYQQYLDSAATLSRPGNASRLSPQTGSPQGSPSASIGPAGMGVGKEGGGVRSSSGQMQAKGKDFLQSAGKAGKGLFAKGKSRFKGSGGGAATTE